MSFHQKCLSLVSGINNISIRKSINIELPFAIFASISYPAFFVYTFHSDIEIIVFSFIHAILSALFVYRMVSKLLLKQHANIGIPDVFILINALYFSASSVKYFEPQLFPGYIFNNSIRFGYSILALAILWGAFELLHNRRQARPVPRIVVRRVNLVRIIIILILLGISHAVITGYLKGPGYLYQIPGNLAQLAIERTYLSTSEKILDWLAGIYPFLLPVFLVLYYKRRGSMVFILISMIIMLAYSLISGARYLFFIFGIELFILLIMIKNIGRKTFTWLILSAPLIVAVISILALSISKRVDIANKELIRWQLAYRFDLTDFAGTLANRRGIINFDHNLLLDAIYRSVPKAIMPDKFNTIVDAYSQQMYKVGLDPIIDYNDTFFSIGAQLFGGIGFLAFPVIMMLFLFLLEKKIYQIFGAGQGLVIIMFMFTLYSAAEADLEGLFATWRMLPIYMMFGIIVFRFLIKPKISPKYQSNKRDFVAK